jgi:hypothetical protein
MPRLLVGFQLITRELSSIQFFLGNVLTELLKAAIVMVSDVGIGLAQLFGNFGECVAFEKMQPKRLFLLKGKRVQHPSPVRSPKKGLERIVILCVGTRSRLNI